MVAVRIPKVRRRNRSRSDAAATADQAVDLPAQQQQPDHASASGSVVNNTVSQVKVAEDVGGKELLYEATVGEAPASVHVTEIVRSGHQSKRWRPANSHNLLLIAFLSVWSWLSNVFRSVFLPDGFPTSVSKDYVKFHLWNFVQGICSTITGMLSTNAILQGLGVGDEAAVPAAATLSYAIRDGVGMLWRILFASVTGPHLDRYCKRWRLLADIVNDLATLVEILTPLFPSSSFLLLLCIATVLRGVVGVSAGAARIAMQQHFAVRNNIGDVSTRQGNQELAATMVGLLLGSVLVAFFGSSPVVLWLAFLVLSALHILANYIGVSMVAVTVLNEERMELVGTCIKGFITDHSLCDIPTPAQLCHKESVFFPLLSILKAQARKLSARLLRRPAGSPLHQHHASSSHLQLHFGASIRALVAAFPTVAQNLFLFESSSYFLWPRSACCGKTSNDSVQLLVDRNGTFHLDVFLFRTADAQTFLHAYLHALVLFDRVKLKPLRVHELEAIIYETWHQVGSKFEECLLWLQQAGWDTSRVTFAQKENRITKCGGAPQQQQQQQNSSE